MDSEKKLYFPMFVDLTDKKVVVVGAGTIAKRRIRTMVAFTSRLVVIAPEVNPELRELEEAGRLTILKKNVREGGPLRRVYGDCRRQRQKDEPGDLRSVQKHGDSG